MRAYSATCDRWDEARATLDTDSACAGCGVKAAREEPMPMTGESSRKRA
jgi:hypothetical protein